MKRATKGRLGGARPGAGRKPGPAHLRRRHSFQVRLNDEERATLEAAAPDGALSGTFIREVALEAVARKKRRSRKKGKR